jgi:hypothetical protein
MSASPTLHIVPGTPTGWFALAIPATMASLVISALAWSQLGLRWASVIVVLAVAAGGAAVAGRRGRDPLTAFLGGTVATVAATYIALLAVAQVYFGVLN